MATNWAKEVSLQTGGLESITEEQWTQILQKLRLHAWRRYKSLHDKLGLDLDDVVHQALADTLEGKRHWPKEEVDLFYFLCSVVKSIVSHRLEQEKRKVSIESFESNYSREGSDLASVEVMITGSIGEYLRYESIYNRLVYDRLIEKMYELVTGDEVLINIVGLWSKDPDLKPSEIAEELGLSIVEMRNAQKRLRRRLKELRGKQNV
jgi:DNA-directed RNA polymerase specialized sigma24 family protein